MKNIEGFLSKEEVDFVKRVFMSPNCKLDQASIHIVDGTEYGKMVPLYEEPERLGLIKCTGSYKWEPVGLEMKLFCDLTIQPMESTELRQIGKREILFPKHKSISNWSFDPDQDAEANLANSMMMVAEKNGMNVNDMNHLFPAVLRMLKSKISWAE